MILSAEHFNLRAVSTALAVSAVSFISDVCPEARATSELSCASAFQFNSEQSQEPESQSHAQQQAHQFVRLLIDSQSEQLSPSERQSRLADAQRVFLELTEARPEVAELIQEEWRKLHSGPKSAIEAHRAELSLDLQILEQQLLELKGQSRKIRKYRVVMDSEKDPKEKAELANLLRSQAALNNQQKPLQLRNWTYQIPIELALWSQSDLAGAVGLYTHLPGGHGAEVNGALVLPDGKALSWSRDRTLILWKLVDGTYVVDHKLGKFLGRDPKKGHTDSVVGAQILPRERILSWSHDHTLILWKRVKDTYVINQRLGKVWNNDPTKGHTDLVYGADLLPDGRILSWSKDGTLILWKLENRWYTIDQRIGEVLNADPQKGHIKWVTKAQFFSDGRLITSDASDRYLLWNFGDPSSIQAEIDAFSREIKALKVELTRLEAQQPSSRDVRTGSGK